MTGPNAELAYKVLDHIDAHPEQWNQGLYIGKAECGTVGCFAGLTVLLSGAEPFYDAYSGGQTDVITVDGRPRTLIVREYAEELLGARSFLDEYTDDEQDLFDGSNSREDLGRLVAEIFGPRPEPVVEMTPPPCADHQVSWLTCDVCTAQRRMFYAALGRSDAS